MNMFVYKARTDWKVTPWPKTVILDYFKKKSILLLEIVMS